MATLNNDFEQLYAHQYCDTPSCVHYGVIGAGNIRIKTRKNKQLYCNSCHSKPFSLHKGTIFYGLRTPIDKVVKVLSLLCSGMGVNAVCREESVTSDSLRSWVVLASAHVEGFSSYMQHEMHLTQVQIDEFWSFIRKKRSI